MELVVNKAMKTVEVATKDFGSVVVYLEDDKNKIGDGYYVTAIKNQTRIAGFVDIDGNEIVPFKEMELDEFFYTPSYQDICLGFKVPDTEILEYYHVKKQDNGNYKVVLKTNPFDQVPLIIREVKEDQNLWIFETVKDDPEYAVYSIEEKRFITNFFDEISFDLEPNPDHHIYFCKYIYSDVNLGDDKTNRIIHTSVCGFFDKKGNFSSQILETEANLLYSSYTLGENSLSNQYKTFLNCLESDYFRKFDEKEESINEVITYLFNNPNLSEPPKNVTPKKTKIIEFKKKDE